MLYWPLGGWQVCTLVPVTTFVISILSGYNMSRLEVVGAVVTMATLVSNNLYQRNILRKPRSARPPGDRRENHPVPMSAPPSNQAGR